jgi:hypothetical protein
MKSCTQIQNAIYWTISDMRVLLVPLCYAGITTAGDMHVTMIWSEIYDSTLFLATASITPKECRLLRRR